MIIPGLGSLVVTPPPGHGVTSAMVRKGLVTTRILKGDEFTITSSANRNHWNESWDDPPSTFPWNPLMARLFWLEWSEKANPFGGLNPKMDVQQVPGPYKGSLFSYVLSLATALYQGSNLQNTHWKKTNHDENNNLRVAVWQTKNICLLHQECPSIYHQHLLYKLILIYHKFQGP